MILPYLHPESPLRPAHELANLQGRLAAKTPKTVPKTDSSAWQSDGLVHVLKEHTSLKRSRPDRENLPQLDTCKCKIIMQC
jgi:hypothetical protein